MYIFKFSNILVTNKGQPQIVSNEEATLPNTQPIIPNITSVPSALPTPNSAVMDDSQQCPLSPNMQKKNVLKKAKGDDLNKYVHRTVQRIFVYSD